MIVKIHKSQNGKVVAICDSDILGKKFEEGDKQLDLTSSFYQGKEKSVDEIIEIFKSAYIINLVGKNSVQLGIQAKIIDPKHVIEINGIPHAQGVMVREDN